MRELASHPHPTLICREDKGLTGTRGLCWVYVQSVGYEVVHCI